MKVLITGTDGFVGPYLVEEMREFGHQVLPLRLHDCDITNPNAFRLILEEEKPEAVMQLAGLSGFDQCLRDPESTWEVNTLAAENIVHLQAEICPGSKHLFVSSGKIYQAGPEALNEESPLKPADFYALTKMSADLRLAQLADSLKLTVIRARAFNHSGPGQSLGFLCPDLIDRLKKQKKGKEILSLGSLSAKVDLSDVRDVVRAYRLLLERADSGAYNVGQGKLMTVGDVVALLEKVIERRIECREEDGLKRDYSETQRLSDISKIKKVTNWKPLISIEQTLTDMWQSVAV
jgi:GDP-4-dehydro-6-deoxy-D-mannose reductase